MTPIAPAPAAGQAVTDYAKQIHFSVPPEKVFDALTTLTGLATCCPTGSALLRPSRSDRLGLEGPS
jgi:uncharacterized protein YndB with AHSA1/START domain